MQRIIFANREPARVSLVSQSLIQEGYDLRITDDGAAALVLIERDRPDLAILDTRLRNLDGQQICQRLRQNTALADLPVLLLTSCARIEDRVRGLDAGADDYQALPCDPREIKARVRALLRRTQIRPTPAVIPVLTFGDIQLNPASGAVSVRGRNVQLTPAELDLLRYLMHHPNRVFSSQHLLQNVWGYPPAAADQGLVRWHMMNLRQKIEQHPSQPTYLRTIPRHGYMLAS